MVFDATKQAGVRALVSSGWVSISNAPLTPISDEMMTIGRPGRSFCSTPHSYTGKCPTRLAFWRRACIGCSPSWRCRNHCHRFGERLSYGRSSFLWRPGILGWEYLANIAWNYGVNSSTQVTWSTNLEQDLNPFHIRNWQRRSWRMRSLLLSAKERRKLQRI